MYVIYIMYIPRMQFFQAWGRPFAFHARLLQVYYLM